ncbi:MAG: fibronectin type III domain-containing protein [Candidatus Komeilibacteria bacterium]
MKNLTQRIIIYFLSLTFVTSGLFNVAQVKAQTALTIDQITIKTDFPGINGTAQAEIKWHNSKSAYSQLRYGLKVNELTNVANTAGLPQSDYTMTLSSLKSDTTYYFAIQSHINSESISSFTRSFKTKKVTDGVAPTFETNISRVETTANTATFQWTTDEETTGTIFYGTNKDKLTASASQSGRSKEHQVTIAGLKPSTTYFFRGQIKDKDNFISNYYVDSFQTPHSSVALEPLIIANLAPNTVNDSGSKENSITVTFTTNYLTKAALTLQGKGVSKTAKTGTLSTTSHSYEISGLKPNTTYNATLSVTDITKRTTKLDKLTFATKDSSRPTTDAATPAAKMGYVTPAVRLIKTANRNTVYALVTPLASGLKLHAIMNPTAFQSYGYQWKKIEVVSSQELQRFQPAKLMRTADNPTVYYVDTERRLKIAIPNEAIFNSYSNKWQDIIYVVPEDLTANSNVELIKEAGSPAVYLLQDGVIHPFASPEALTKRGYNMKQIMTVNSYHRSYFTRGDILQ